MADGSTAAALANEVTITNDGLLVLMFAVVAVLLCIIGYLGRVVAIHLKECSGHRARFHDADRRIERKLAVLGTNMSWLMRKAGHDNPPAMPDAEPEE